MASGPTISPVLVTDIPVPDAGAIRFIELNRPGKLNCLSLAMLGALRAALQAGENSSAIVLTGAGRSFCAGLDLKEIGGPEGATWASAGRHLQLLVEIYRWFLAARIPTLVLARGFAAGGGAGLAACAQTAVVAADFRYKLPGGPLAGLAAVAVPLFNLRSADGPRTDWLGREWDAKSAGDAGLVDRVLSPEQWDDSVRAIKRGQRLSELMIGRRKSPPAVIQAQDELDRFLRSLARRPPG